jgi:ribosomal protein S7
VHDGKRQAGIDAAAVGDDRTGAALAVVAAFLGAGQMQVFAQRVEQARPRIELERMNLPVDVQ